MCDCLSVRMSHTLLKVVKKCLPDFKIGESETQSDQVTALEHRLLIDTALTVAS